ncbi:unnamed protein product [Brassica napus]|uniref:(rape) hypothetical protein n=1 Tax=Brassica napus TaxID=3708 RepID=A0A816SQ92_BRANA|nr:unnamed protein product [Brassica napus]
MLALPVDCPCTDFGQLMHHMLFGRDLCTCGLHFIGQSEILGGGSNLSDKGLNLSGSWQQGHSATYNTPSHVPPQPNSPPDNVLRSDRPAEASLGSKRRGCYPTSDSRILSWLLDARESSRKSCSQSVPRRHEAVRLATLAAQAARQQSTGSNWDPEPSPQSQSFSRLRIHFARLPLPTLFHRPEAVHLGDLMRL